MSENETEKANNKSKHGDHETHNLHLFAFFIEKSETSFKASFFFIYFGHLKAANKMSW